ncbi:MAG: bifunctional DNA-formamidopyrimidine glycosylase/DNA-(apurinic or apyrimidinic site) lyase [Nostocoides sp.]
MPELPEVEVVRRGLVDHVVGRRIEHLELRGERVARRHQPGPADLAAQVAGRQVAAAHRRGKYLWLVLTADEEEDLALLIHLGMSGQLLVSPADAAEEKHLRASFTFADAGRDLRFVDQRTFGGLALSPLPNAGGDERASVPTAIAHIAADPFDPCFDAAATVRRFQASASAVKRVMLDQRVVSGIGNIYADEALWRARIHGERPSASLSRASLAGLLRHTKDVMSAALAQGGTSFDALYVNVNGTSGYFERSLEAYGRAGRPCSRCGTPIRRVSFMNRSSYFCPRCQRASRPRS